MKKLIPLWIFTTATIEELPNKVQTLTLDLESYVKFFTKGATTSLFELDIENNSSSKLESQT